METNKCRSGIIRSDIYFTRIYTSIADTLTSVVEAVVEVWSKFKDSTTT